MAGRINRRELLGWSTAVAAGGVVGAGQAPAAEVAPVRRHAPRKMKLGMVTYNLAKDWDLQTILERCPDVGIEAVEFRTTHRHGVEPSLSAVERKDVRKRCEDAGVLIWGLGTACDFHARDPAVVESNIQETLRFVDLAADLGARGVKVRPNAFPEGVSQEKTLDQIGRSLRRCGEAAAGAGVEIWCEMHGRGTAHPPHMRTMVDIADLPNVGVIWNSNKGVDEKDGSVREHFKLLQDKILGLHINELINGYPYRELFALLNEAGYDRYAMIEAQSLKSEHVEDTVRFMKFYKALWEEWSRG